MENYDFQCFHTSWETEPLLKAGLPDHASSDILTVSVPQENGNTTGEHERGHHHFLDACFRCGRLLGRTDIFMYRGGTPFCSEECRQQEIDADEARERRRSKRQPAAATAAAKRRRKQRPHMHVWLPPHMHVAIGAAAPLVRRTTSPRPPRILQAVASKMDQSVRRLPKPNLGRVAAWVFGRHGVPHLPDGELRRCGREPNMACMM